MVGGWVGGMEGSGWGGDGYACLQAIVGYREANAIIAKLLKKESSDHADTEFRNISAFVSKSAQNARNSIAQASRQSGIITPWKPYSRPASRPASQPANQPASQPPNYRPTDLPTYRPTDPQTDRPADRPTYRPTYLPTYLPTDRPTYLPTDRPTYLPNYLPTDLPTYRPTDRRRIERRHSRFPAYGGCRGCASCQRRIVRSGGALHPTAAIEIDNRVPTDLIRFRRRTLCSRRPHRRRWGHHSRRQGSRTTMTIGNRSSTREVIGA